MNNKPHWTNTDETVWDAKDIDGEQELEINEEHGFDFRGDMAISIGIPNVHAWYGWNKDAVEVLKRLQDRGIMLRDESQLTYYYDGLVPNLPIASASNIRRKAGYKEEHWFPASLVFVEGTQ